jgi:hypothetical protein
LFAGRIRQLFELRKCQQSGDAHGTYSLPRR